MTRLINADELENKILDNFGEEICCDTVYPIENILNYVRQTPTVMQWVSVDNEKPKINQRVLIVNKASDVYEGMLTLSDGELMWHMLFDVFDSRLDNKCCRCLAELPEVNRGHSIDRWGM